MDTSKQKSTNNFPERLSNPAKRALAGAGIYSLEQLSRSCEAEIRKLHGIGPSALKQLKAALETEGLAFDAAK